MGMSAFNRARRQKMALADAKARDDAAQNKDLRAQPPEKMTEAVDHPETLASPPYADEGQLINIPADADRERERKAFQQALRNRDRVPTDEEIETLSNSHLRDDKTKAIPDANESGKDRTLKGQEASRRKASEPYEDPRVEPQKDGRLRVNEPEEERPDGDTTVSKSTRQDPTPPVKDDDPATVDEIIAESEPKAEKRIEKEAETPILDIPADPGEAAAKGATLVDVRKPEPAPSQPPVPETKEAESSPPPKKPGRPAKSE